MQTTTHNSESPRSIHSIHPPFGSVTEFCRYFRVTLPKCTVQGTAWRLTPRVTGRIQGLPASYGMLLATDGILCFIDQGADASVQPYLGHIGWFIPDDKSVDVCELRTGKKTPAPRETTQERGIRLMLEMQELGY